MPWKSSRPNIICFLCIFILSFFVYSFVPHIQNILIRTYGPFFISFIFALLIITIINPFKQNINKIYITKNQIYGIIITTIILVISIFSSIYTTFYNSPFKPGSISVIYLFGYLVAAIEEELLFKGLFIPFLRFYENNEIITENKNKKRFISYWLFAILLSILFAFSHRVLSILPLIALFFLSIFSFILFYFWRSLTIVIFYHFIHNIFAFITKKGLEINHNIF